jgi:sodium transport system permease protein
VFGVFHFLVHKFVSAAALGLVLGYLCVRSRSIMPAVVMHFLHNALSLSTLFWPWRKTLGISADDASDHLPAWLIVAGCAALVGGMALLGRTSNEPTKGAAEAARPG